MSAPPRSKPIQVGILLVMLGALAYCAWLGAHWLPLDWSDKELAASASRVWDIKSELTTHHTLPWWTPNFMSGSSYGLNHARGFYLLPWLLLSTVTDLETAGKLLALAAMFASAVGMFYCARYFLKNNWAAALAALVFLLHPEQINRAARYEHLTISLFFPFIPLLWLTFARVLDTGRWREVLTCAIVVALAMWTDNKQALIQFVFMFGYLIVRLVAAHDWQRGLRTSTMTGIAALVLSVGFLLPGIVESKYVKLFAGDPIAAWQRTYSFKSLLALVDRNAAVTRATMDGLVTQQRTGGWHPVTQTEAANLQSEIGLLASLAMDSPEKYAGLVVLALAAITMSVNRQRTARVLFWFFVGMLMLCVALSMGPNTVWSANVQTWQAIFGVTGVPGTTRFVAVLGLAALGACLVWFARRKLTTPKQWALAGAVLVVFLFVPLFTCLAQLPLFKDIRAPAAFYASPSAFLLAMLAGFFVTDVLVERASRPFILAGLAALLVFDYWPYQQPMKDTGVPARTLQNLQAAYGSLRADPDWVKTYSFSGRYFHLLGPMYGGKPQVYEAFYNWQAPVGLGLLNQAAWQSLDSHRAFLNLVGARYVVFDKSDPNNANPQSQQILAAYRQLFPVALENDDFAVFRNDTAHGYVTAYRRAYLDPGDLRQSAPVALALAARDWPAVYQPVTNCDRAYPSSTGQRVALTGLQLTRVNHGAVRIAATAPAPCLAVLAESWYPFWRATVDDQPVEVLRVSTGLMGLELPAGAHQIELRYEPPRLYAAAAGVSLLSLTGAIGWLIFARRRPILPQ